MIPSLSVSATSNISSISVSLTLFFSLIFFFLCLKEWFYRDGEVFHNVGELSLREAVLLLLPLFRSLIRLAEWKDWFIKLKSLNWSQNSLFKGFLLKLGWFFNNSDNGASLPLLYHSIIHEARQEKEGEFEEKTFRCFYISKECFIAKVPSPKQLVHPP